MILIEEVIAGQVWSTHIVDVFRQNDKCYRRSTPWTCYCDSRSLWASSFLPHGRRYFCNKGSSFWFFRSALSHQNGFESTQYHTESNLEDVMMTMIMMMVMMFWGTDVADDGHQSLGVGFSKQKTLLFLCLLLEGPCQNVSGVRGEILCKHILFSGSSPPLLHIVWSLYFASFS